MNEVSYAFIAHQSESMENLDVILIRNNQNVPP